MSVRRRELGEGGAQIGRALKVVNTNASVSARCALRVLCAAPIVDKWYIFLFSLRFGRVCALGAVRDSSEDTVGPSPPPRAIALLRLSLFRII